MQYNDYLVINAKEDTHPMINKLLSYVQYYNKDIPQNKDSVKKSFAPTVTIVITCIFCIP